MSVDLRTIYLGLDLESPIVASASPLTGELESLKRLEEAGVSAVVLPSLFEEQIEHEEVELDAVLEHGAHSFGEALSYFPELEDYNTGPESYLEHVAAAKAELDVPVIASLNGASDGGWLRYARLLEEAGADAIELNVYAVEVDPDSPADAVEERTLTLVRSVRETVSVPLAVKVGPFYSALAHMARRLSAAGADGLVLFNRFLQPDIDLETLSVSPELHLSTPEELRLPLRWIAILRGRVDVDLAGTGGVHSSDDVIKLLLAGADVVMLASALLLQGEGHVKTLRTGIEEWLTGNEYESVEQLKGSMSHSAAPDPAAFERSQYMRALVSYTPKLGERGTTHR